MLSIENNDTLWFPSSLTTQYATLKWPKIKPTPFIFISFYGSVAEIKTNPKNKYLSNKKADPNLPALIKLSKRPSVDEITEEVEYVFREDQVLARGVKIYLCHKHTGKMLKEIGRHFDIGDFRGIASKSSYCHKDHSR